MTSQIYQSVFASEFADSSGSIATGIPTPATVSGSVQESYHQSQGSLGSFVCRLTSLENDLQVESASFLVDNNGINNSPGVQLGTGASFSVERKELNEAHENDLNNAPVAKRKYVAVKRVKEAPGTLTRSELSRHLHRTQDLNHANWMDIILEIRALLHKPLRYHPNIVHLLNLGWRSSIETGSIFPTLVMEYAAFGSLSHLQAHSSPLPFRVKQKLCYDVARGLSILHACGIVHGDLKHENVLIFENRYDTLEGQPYTAKLADFGGSILDIEDDESNRLRMCTFPYEAPEAGQKLDANGIKKTDVYSFGMLIWRTFIDGEGIVEELGLSDQPRESVRGILRDGKVNDDLLINAINSVEAYAEAKAIPSQSTDMILYCLDTTLRADPNGRDFVAAQSRLKGMDVAQVAEHLLKTAAENKRKAEAERTQAPGTHGLTIDSLGYFSGRFGKEYDAQANIPGNRPNLSEPIVGGYLFDPHKLKKVLHWDQQAMMVADFKRAASSKHTKSSTEPEPWKAAFYLFQCYLAEFGVGFDAKEACHWLHEASKADDEGDIDYWARAWLWRIFNAFNVPVPWPRDELLENLRFGLFRGHRNCMEDSNAIMPQIKNFSDRTEWEKNMKQADWVLRTVAGGVGMPHYVPRKLRRPYDLDDLNALDDLIKAELGSRYDDSLRKQTKTPGFFTWSIITPKDTAKESPFDDIYVNHKGHSLLHYAATAGNLSALRHLIDKYRCNIDIENKSVDESPLVCASRSANFDCAMFLLERGANPDIVNNGQEAPLHWLCSIPQEHMATYARRLISAGADLEKKCDTMRTDIRMINADWEDVFGIPTSPLGRAVIMRNLPAIRVLLELGADPFKKGDYNTHGTCRSPAELAAVLNLPHILETLLTYADQKNGTKERFWDETEMLKAAHECVVTPFDPTTLQSRLVRCGSNYKTWMHQTLKILHDRRKRLRDWTTFDNTGSSPEMQLCAEVKLGNVDVVESLLELGHSPHGSANHRPIEEAVLANHPLLFCILINHGAPLNIIRRAEGWVHFNLLQISASRPRTSRSGTVIAEYLIRSKVPIEPLLDGSPSALVFAVKNRLFDLADLLLSKGADINAPFQTSQTGPTLTLLADLLRIHSYASLESINYLFQHTPAGETPAFIVNQTDNLSVLHLLALTPLASITPITPKIIQRVLAAFPLPEHINASHPTLGTPLCAAALTGNVDLIDALCDAGADTTLPAPPLDKITRSQIEEWGLPEWIRSFRPSEAEREKQTPGMLVGRAYEAEIRAVLAVKKGELTEERFALLKKIKESFMRLWEAGGENERDLRSLWRVMVQADEVLKGLMGEKKVDFGKGSEKNEPVDLGGLSEEKAIT